MARGAGGGSAPWIAFILGGLLVAVAVIAYVLYAGGLRQQAPRGVDIDVDLPTPPALPDAPKLPDPPLPTPK